MTASPARRFNQVLSPVHGYRDNEDVFHAEYPTRSTLPDFPSPVSGLVCSPLYDTVSFPATGEVGTDGAPESSSPTLWFQLTWSGERPPQIAACLGGTV